MKIVILKQNEDGYLPANVNGTYYPIDDYSGTFEVGDVLQINEIFHGKGKYNCRDNCGKPLWINVAGDIDVPNEYFPYYTK